MAEQYIFEDRIAEQRRLDAHSQFVDRPLTRPAAAGVLVGQGVGPGMRVLDLGCRRGARGTACLSVGRP